MTHDEVLIIGAGPAGLFAAAELSRHGVSARLIERDLQPHRQARATGIQPGTLEILDSVGLLPAFLAASEHVRCARLYGPDMRELVVMHLEGLDCSCQFQCSLPQYETQRILEEHLTSLGGKVERGINATKVEIDGDDAIVELTHADGRIETTRPRILIGAGGAHSVTRHAMSETLFGTTYSGCFLVADVAMQAPVPRDESGVVCTPHGLLLLAPLPGGRWLTFQDLEEDVHEVSPEELSDRIARRIGDQYRPSDVSWISPFRMHRRIVSRMSHRRRFLIGDAAHLSSPFGGEGLNAALHDGFNLAWKLSLLLRGRASQALIDGYSLERRIADQHVLAVSDEIHLSIAEVLETIRRGESVQPTAVDPVTAALARNARMMLDVDYSASPLVVDYGAGKAQAPGPHPGQWYPDWPRFGGTAHRVIVFGDTQDADALERFERKWRSLVEVSYNPEVAPNRAGLPIGGIVLVRPDGHIAFRIPTRDADAVQALDRHLESYLIPESSN